ncbi:hypothetical protein NKH18_45230 [Streptomyces sp. M10(2022)]
MVWHKPNGPAPWVIRLQGSIGAGLLSGDVPMEDFGHLLSTDPALGSPRGCRTCPVTPDGRRTRPLLPADAELVLLLPANAEGPAVDGLLETIHRVTGRRPYTAYGLRGDLQTDPTTGLTTFPMLPGRRRPMGSPGSPHLRRVAVSGKCGRVPYRPRSPSGGLGSSSPSPLRSRSSPRR